MAQGTENEKRYQLHPVILIYNNLFTKKKIYYDRFRFVKNILKNLCTKDSREIFNYTLQQKFYQKQFTKNN